MRKNLSAKNLRRGSEAGFSLIELLVAVAILAALSIPLLQGFIGTHRASSKAALLQGANLLGSNLMETMRAHTVEEIQSLYGPGEETEEGLVITLKEAEQAGILYDARVIIERKKDAPSYAAPVTYDPAQDMVFTAQPAGNGMRRKIVLTITAADETLSRVSCVQYNDAEEVSLNEDSGESPEAVRNIFLIYPPNYASTASTYEESTTEYADTIEIVNQSAYPARIVVMKERLKTGNIAERERAYRVRLKTVWPETVPCEIYSNLNYNIAAGYAGTGGYREALIHQTLTDLNTTLLPLEGVSHGAGSFYPVSVEIYSAGALSNETQEDAVLTLRNTGE